MRVNPNLLEAMVQEDFCRVTSSKLISPKVDAIEKKLLANAEAATLIG